MKRHALKICIGLFVIISAAATLLCLYFSDNIENMKKTVNTESKVLDKRLSSTDPVANIDKPFNTDNLLSRIRSNWTRSPEIPKKDLPTSVLLQNSPTSRR